jgi:hypothetical protein
MLTQEEQVNKSKTAWSLGTDESGAQEMVSAALCLHHGHYSADSVVSSPG